MVLGFRVEGHDVSIRESDCPLEGEDNELTLNGFGGRKSCNHDRPLRLPPLRLSATISGSWHNGDRLSGNTFTATDQRSLCPLGDR